MFRDLARGILFALLTIATTGALAGAPPVEVLDVDLSRYPAIRVVAAGTSPHPPFVAATESGRRHFTIEEIYSDKVTEYALQEVSVETQATRLNLVLIIDATQSVSRQAFEESKNVAQSIVRSLRSEDRVAIYVLRGEPRLLRDFTTDKDDLVTAIRRIERDGLKTRLYDTLYSGIYTASGALEGSDGDESQSRTAVVVLTDGRDEDSYLNDNDCFEITGIGQRLNIPVFVVLHGERVGDVPLLKRLSLKTGGALWIRPGEEQTLRLHEKLRELPRSIYTLQYESENTAALFGDRIVTRLIMYSGGNEFVDVSSYDVPISGYLRSLSGNPLLYTVIVIVLLVLLALLVLALVALLTRSARSSAHTQEVAPHSDPLVGEMYLENAAAVPDAALPAAEDPPPPPLPENQAGVVMEDERLMYMREYGYRMLQLALREANSYSRATLIQDRGKSPRREYDLFLESTVIGTGRWANISVNNDNMISPVHARIKRVDNRFVIFDLLSATGVYLNGRKLLRPRALNDGDELRIGRTRFQFQAS